MTIRKARDVFIRRSGVPLPAIYSSISEIFRIEYADETGVPGVEVVSAAGGTEVGWVAVPPGPGDLGSWLIWRQYPQPDAAVGVLIVPLKGSVHSPRLVCTPPVYLTDSHPTWLCYF